MADVTAAREAADAAAAASGVVVTEAESREAQDAARALFDEVWPGDRGTQVTPNLLRALLHAGSYCSVATDVSTGAHVGAAFGFPGRDARVPGGIFLHSHMAGVTEGLRDRRIGTALKLHQRWWVMREGIPIVSWTFDPLVRRNARLNVIRLGVEVRDYHPDFYGVMTDAINAGDRTDRLVAWWVVDSERAGRAAAGGLSPAESQRLRKAGARDLVAVGAAGEPVVGPPPRAGESLIVALPEDVVAIRRRSPEVALDWRLAVRDALVGAFAAGLSIDTVTEEGSYVLTPRGEA